MSGIQLDSNLPLVLRARLFATNAHGANNQRRKYTDEPYIVHPASVVRLVASVSHSPAMLAAAWLHDVVEDTPVTIEGIQEAFGSEVSELVDFLTDVSRPSDGNRQTRKAIDRDHIALAPISAKTIKLADLIDNTRSIVRYDPGFARIYLREKALLLEVLSDGDATLLSIAREQLSKGQRHIFLD